MDPVLHIAYPRGRINTIFTRAASPNFLRISPPQRDTFREADASMTTARLPLMDISNNDAASSPVAPGGRRKSGRAVKAPEKFQPAPESTNAKRKRGGEDAENDASDVDEGADASDSAQESAEEEDSRQPRRKAKTTKKPAAKKPKVNGASHTTAPTVRLPARPKKTKRVVIDDDSAEGLYGKRKTPQLHM